MVVIPGTGQSNGQFVSDPVIPGTDQSIGHSLSDPSDVFGF